MGWTVINWILGIVCIVGPLMLIGWYISALKARIGELKENQGPDT